MERWSGKVALVTGASAGIGAAIAVELVKNGLVVVGLARRSENVDELKTLVGKHAGNLHSYKGDVSKEEDIIKVFQFIKEKFGKIHVLVNNAGVERPGYLTDMKLDDIRAVFDLNVIGLSICTQQAYQLMKETGVDDGHIVHINSSFGINVPPIPGTNVYPASKFAVTALTETLRQELRFFKSNIRVTSISPGAVNTDLITRATAKLTKEQQEFLKTLPRLNPKDIADGVVYVLSTPPHVQVHQLTIKPLGEPIA